MSLFFRTATAFFVVSLAMVQRMEPVLASVEKHPRAFVVCKNQKDVRTIAVSEEVGDAGCQTLYSKEGRQEVVEKSRFLGSCKARLREVQDHLQSSRYSCRSVNKVQMMSSSELESESATTSALTKSRSIHSQIR